MRLFELVIEDENTDEVFQISLVENPAIEAFGVFFDKEEVYFAEMEEEGLFMSPILIPDRKILRVDGEGNSYQVYFTAATIKRLSQMYLEKKYQSNVNIEHKDKVDNVTLVESWIKESAERDKSKLYGLNVPVGSWIGTFKIDNEEVKEKFRNGELRAVSIEGLFEHLQRNTPEELQAAMIMDMWNKHINELSEVEAELMLSVIGDMIELESFTDYGDDIRNNAKRGIELNEKNGNKCATQTGKVRAQQLANGEPISVETIKRMYSFLSRAETYYDESDTSACGTISYLLWGGKAALSYSRNKLRELGLLEENEAQPSVNSTYPGEVASGSIAPATFSADCPPATQNVEINLENRASAIEKANYGPLNPNEPNEGYWKNKAKEFGDNVVEAKKALCGNCAFFDIRKETLDCISEGIGIDNDPELVIEAGQLGYCKAFEFKCAAKRTCSAWVVGGPIKD